MTGRLGQAASGAGGTVQLDAVSSAARDARGRAQGWPAAKAGLARGSARWRMRKPRRRGKRAGQQDSGSAGVMLRAARRVARPCGPRVGGSACGGEGLGVLGRAPAHGKAGSGARACTWAAPRQVHARAWPGQRGEQAALQRAGEERGKEGEREGEKEKKKGKGREKKKRKREREKRDRSADSVAAAAPGRAWCTGRGGTGRRDSGWISGPGFREIGRGMILNGMSSTIEKRF